MHSLMLLVLLQAPGQPLGDPVLLWNEETLLAIRTARTPPPAAARNLAIVHAAVFDAVNTIGRGYTPFLVNTRAPAGTSPETAASVAAHRALTGLYPDQAKRFDAVLRRALLDVPDGPGKDEGAALGKYVAEEMLAWRAKDGHLRKVRFEPEEIAGLWKPTPPNFREALLPQWPYLVPFALPELERFRPAPPPALTSAEYTANYREVKLLGGTRSEAHTAEQTIIARFWADGEGTVTPPGHWNRIAQNAARARGKSPGENARLFALLNLALADAAICCWDCKYRFNVWRPIQAVREADRDGNSATEPDAGWTPLLETPPFPSYTSGHSTFSAAGAAVLASFFGTDRVKFSTESDGLPGVTRSFNSFWTAAREAGKSRVYGGIHYEFDNAAGLETGRKIGEFISSYWLQPR